MNNLFLFIVNIFRNDLTKNQTGEDVTIEILGMLIGALLLGFLLRHFMGFLRKKEIIMEKMTDEQVKLSQPMSGGSIDSSALDAQVIALRKEVDRLTSMKICNCNCNSEDKANTVSNNIIQTPTITPPVVENILPEVKAEVVVPEVKNDHSAYFPPVNETITTNPIIETTAPPVKIAEIVAPPVQIIEPIIESIPEPVISIPEPIAEIPILQTPPVIQTEIEEPVARKSIVSVTKDDLKVIEGVGPAIEKLLNENGIMSFSQMATTSKEHLEGILDAAGPRFRVHVPDTWPQQAILLSENRMTEFNALKDALRGGRVI